MTESSVVHASFALERIYPVSRSKTFAAWASPVARLMWRNDPDFSEDTESPGSGYSLDFRIGGHETFGGVAPDGVKYHFDGVTYDIVDDERIVFAYEMYLDGQRISVSVATVEFTDVADGTRQVYTENGAFLDGLDDPKEREGGTSWLMDNLGKFLESQPVA